MSVAADIEGTRIVGSFDLSGDGLGGLGFLYDSETHEFVSLGTLPGGTRSVALAVNSAGQIAGYWGNHVIGPWQTFIWENGEMIDLGPSIGGLHNRGFDINEAGSITGRWRSKEGDELMAFLWHDGRMTDLGPIPGGFSSQGEGINIHNQIAGWGILPDPDGGGTLTHAFFWENGRMIDLGTLPGFPRGGATAINDAGTIVGQSWGAGQAGFIWQDGVMTDLNELVPPEFEIDSANAINNTGQITGTAIVPTGIAAVLLTPIEPPPGDLDGDCAVGVSDLLMLLANWGPCKNCDDCRADLDGDCSVGVKDLLILLGNWG
ncbi:MAG: hypothetical protein IIC46_06595 [Planctomycetes bacterium]|nr:hypothetical protein [Planctomycetota bacterium]